uniref:Uncharacterized protein n=1 Tax=Glyptapanteles indiensis TaxID=92994 RepID=A0JCU5_GLYIN|nr:hypothetical protein GIP_L1_00160 [Glyptapanteles indiensis]
MLLFTILSIRYSCPECTQQELCRHLMLMVRHSTDHLIFILRYSINFFYCYTGITTVQHRIFNTAEEHRHTGVDTQVLHSGVKMSPFLTPLFLQCTSNIVFPWK